MTDVKICGIKEADLVTEAAEAGALWVGFVLHPKSPRNILGEGKTALQDAEMLLEAAHEAGLRSVILTANADDALNEAVVRSLRPHALQLHGRETPSTLVRLKTMAKRSEIWKAIGVARAGDLRDANAFDAADRLVIDAKAPAGSQIPGGNGEPFDWSILEGWQSPKPWLLSGGLTPDTVGEAIRRTGAEAVDVSSGVESAPGVKDGAKIRAFVSAAVSARKDA